MVAMDSHSASQPASQPASQSVGQSVSARLISTHRKAQDRKVTGRSKHHRSNQSIQHINERRPTTIWLWLLQTLRTKCVETESGSLCETPFACRAAEMASDVRMPPLGASPNDHLRVWW
jgi:hypothetical protein